MATLLSSVSLNGAGTGQSHSGPCTVHVPANSVFDGATVAIEIADSDTSAQYQKIDSGAIFRDAGSITVDAKGTYFLRANLQNAGIINVDYLHHNPMRAKPYIDACQADDIYEQETARILAELASLLNVLPMDERLRVINDVSILCDLQRDKGTV